MLVSLERTAGGKGRVSVEFLFLVHVYFVILKVYVSLRFKEGLLFELAQR